MRKSNITIERVITDSRGRIIAIDLHDEKFGEAVYLEMVDRHFHGYNKRKTKKK